MTELSRTKKYEDLRQQIQNDREGDVRSEALSPYANRLSRLDSNFRPMETTSSKSHNPMHIKKEVRFDSFTSHDPSDVPTFNNQYINEFIEEVKNYNIKKGYRNFEETSSNVLAEATGKGNYRESMTRFRNDRVYLEPARTLISNEEEIPEHQTSLSLSYDEQNLTQEIKRILGNEPDNTPVIRQLPETEDIPAAEDSIEKPVDNQFSSMLEETQKMRIQLDNYEEKLTGVNTSVSNSNRLLNFVVIVLVLLLLLMLSLGVYWVLYARGYF